MKILVLSFYYKPDLCAGSFRNTALVESLLMQLDKNKDSIEVITTMPNRYSTFINDASECEKQDNLTINRIPLPQHKSGLIDQIFAFNAYFWKALKLSKNKDYDIIYASSSRLFTAVLGAVIARRANKPFYIDIRDIFVDTMKEVINSKVLKLVLIPTLTIIERFTIKKATHLNLVSEGFKDYFSYFEGRMSFYSNGVDKEFLDTSYQDMLSDYKPGNIKIVTYAGNIGEGQGLEKVLPQIASKMGEKYLFRVIGDGGTKQKLECKLRELGVNNVELIQPVNREKLKQYYAESDYLFMHLNDYEAFKKVLPSKIFEYGATNKTIIAGVGGYAQKFVEDNVLDVIIFNPGDVESLETKMLAHTPTYKKRNVFTDKFDRNKIMSSMSKSIVLLKKK
jgi:hypothetical protein